VQYSSIRHALAFIDNQLGTVCTNAFLHGKVIEELTASLLGSGTPRVRTALEMVDIEPKKTTPINLIENNWTEQSGQLQAGDWFMLFREGEESEPLKLVWIGDTLDVFVFVNRDGLKKLELNREELAELMRNGAISKIDSLDVPLMDRATNMMLQKMYERLIYNAGHDPITALYNRREFIKRLKQEMPKLTDSQHMLCHIELLDYRMITNACGLAGGDELLKEFCGIIKNQLRDEDILARLGDKTFGILYVSATRRITPSTLILKTFTVTKDMGFRHGFSTSHCRLTMASFFVVLFTQ
jgi:GGDEF domain-containing protein